MERCKYCIKWLPCNCGRNDEQYLLNREELHEVVKTVINEAYSSWGWGESMDIGVMWLRIDKIVEPNKVWKYEQ